jgi:hypothetical protein
MPNTWLSLHLFTHRQSHIGYFKHHRQPHTFFQKHSSKIPFLKIIYTEPSLYFVTYLYYSICVFLACLLEVSGSNFCQSINSCNRGFT